MQQIIREIKITSQFRKSLKKISKSGRYSEAKLAQVIDSLAANKILHSSFHDHALLGKFINHRECHIGPDLLLIYRIENQNLVLVLVNIGSHSNLF